MFVLTNIRFKWRIYYICLMPDLPKKLKSKLSRRAEANMLRKLPSQNDLVDFSSNDYLGFALDQEIYEETLKMASDFDKMKNGATGSRLLTGNHWLYGQLENRLAEIFGTGSALVFNSGYDANVGFFSSVPQRGDFVFYDEYIHASIRDGIKMGNATSYKFKHNDLKDLKSRVRQSVGAQSRTADTNVYIVTESVFSMDGDSPDLMSLAQFCAGNDLRLIVDEAHAIGVIGPSGTGLVQQLGVQGLVFARVVTFSKALGCHGAAILGENDLKGYLTNFARSFIYTTALPPHSVATIMISFRKLTSHFGVEQLERLHRIMEYFRNKVDELKLAPHFIPSDSAIHSCLIKTNENVKNLSIKLGEEGFDVRPILSPTVPKGQERLRFCLHSFNTKEEIDFVLQLLKNYF